MPRPDQNREIVLKVEDLVVDRGGTRVLDKASLTVRRGDYVGIVGPNGGGKTTLLRTILGYQPRVGGRVRLFGDDIETFDQWHRVAHVAQDATSFDHQFPLSVRELVSLGRVRRSNLLRRLDAEDRAKVEETMAFMGIAELAERRIGQLSGGQKQRAFVAKALALGPELLILDEPLSGMDAETQERFYKVLSNLNKERGTTILVVSHDLAAVFCRMNRLVCVNRQVYESDMLTGTDEVLRKTYGEHFHFVLHDHKCEGIFDGI